MQGVIVDLRDLVGCEIPGGVVVATPSGSFARAVYYDDCWQFNSAMIPAVELRPGPSDSWLCYDPPSGRQGIMMTG